MKLKYFPALDGLRALSIFLIVLVHWRSGFLTVRFGWLAVNIFFVLSGFLITRILLDQKTKPFKSYLGKFYKNRALRIFPLYYSSIALILFLLIVAPHILTNLIPETFIIKDLSTIKFDVLYISTYLYNFVEVFRVFDGQGNNQLYLLFGHFWSLAVEEQYYLVFPFLVYLLPTRTLKWVFILIILLTPPLRLLFGEFFRETQHINTAAYALTKLPFFYLDAFAIGGILHFIPADKLKFPLTWLSIYVIIFAILGLVTVANLNQYRIFIGWDSFGFDHPLFQYGQQTPKLWLNVRYAFTFSIVNLGAGLLILALLEKNWLSALFSHPAIAFSGRISYGMYILHLPLLVLTKYYIQTTAISISPVLDMVLFILFYSVLIIICWFIYSFFESYFLRLKHR